MKRFKTRFALVEILILVAILGLLAAFTLPRAMAAPIGSPPDATAPAVDPAPLPDSAIVHLGRDLRDFFVDNTNLFNQGTVTVEAGGLYNSGHYGGFLDVQFPIEQQLSLGFAVAYLDKQFYDAALSARLGTTWQVPVLGPVYTYVESGPGYNLSKRSVVEQSFAGGLWKHQFSEKWGVTIGGAVGHISDLTGPVYAAGASINYKFK